MNTKSISQNKFFIRHPEAIHSRHPEKRSDEGSLRDSSPMAQNDVQYSDTLAQNDDYIKNMFWDEL